MAEFAHIGQSVTIKGEVSGSEDLYIDGAVVGKIELRAHNLVIEPHGRVHGEITAKSVVVSGKLDGNIHAAEKAEFRKTAAVVGDVVSGRVSIEEGAFLKGKIEVTGRATEAGTNADRARAQGA